MDDLECVQNSAPQLCVSPNSHHLTDWAFVVLVHFLGVKKVLEILMILNGAKYFLAENEEIVF